MKCDEMSNFVFTSPLFEKDNFAYSMQIKLNRGEQLTNKNTTTKYCLRAISVLQK